MTFNYVLNTSSEEKRFPNYLLLYKIFLRVNPKKLFLCSTIICVSRFLVLSLTCGELVSQTHYHFLTFVTDLCRQYPLLNFM